MAVQTSPAMRDLLMGLAARLFPIGAPSTSEGWGNTTSKARVTDALAALRANQGASTGKSILIGASHGAAVALNWAADNPTLTACVVCIIPAIDLQAIRVANLVISGDNLRSSTDTAFGVTYPATVPTGTDPATRTAALTGIPIQLWTASDDAVSENAATFAAAVGAETHNLGALGHTEAALAAVTPSAVESFIEAAVA